MKVSYQELTSCDSVGYKGQSNENSMNLEKVHHSHAHADAHHWCVGSRLAILFSREQSGA